MNIPETVTTKKLLQIVGTVVVLIGIGWGVLWAHQQYSDLKAVEQQQANTATTLNQLVQVLVNAKILTVK